MQVGLLAAFLRGFSMQAGGESTTFHFSRRAQSCGFFFVVGRRVVDAVFTVPMLADWRGGGGKNEPEVFS